MANPALDKAQNYFVGLRCNAVCSQMQADVSPQDLLKYMHTRSSTLEVYGLPRHSRIAIRRQDNNDDGSLTVSKG